jgi:PEP-CTERM motif-containing protein
MGIGPRAVGIAIGALLVVMLGQTVKADSFIVTGQTDVAFCVSNGFQCDLASYRLNLTTSPLTYFVQDGVRLPEYFVSSLTGTFSTVDGTFNVALSTVNAFPTLVDGGPISAAESFTRLDPLIGNPQPQAHLDVTIHGLPAFFRGDEDFSQYPHPVLTSGYPGQTPGSETWVSWNAVSTPEPSTLLFLSIGLLGLMGLTLLKNRLS